MSDKTLPNCNDCLWAIMKDYGISNYTLEGVEFHCVKEIHPDSPFDRWYGEDERLSYASECASFAEGDNTRIDCDLDCLIRKGVTALDRWGEYTTDPEIAEYLDIFL